MAITDPLDTIGVTFTFPREAWENPDGILDAFAAHGWQERISSQDERNPTFDAETKTVLNPITKEQHAINKVQDFVDEIWAAHVVNANVENARKQTNAGLSETRKVVRDNTKTTIKRNR